MTPARLSDEELLEATKAARLAAHEAPKQGTAYADRSREFFTLLSEVRRRGLPYL